MAKKKDYKRLLSNLNPKNIGVTDFSEEKSFGSAYKKARSSGEKEFMYNGKRFNTNYKGTPKQQLAETGITDDQLLKNNIIRDRLYKNTTDFEYQDYSKVKNVFDANSKEQSAINKRLYPIKKVYNAIVKNELDEKNLNINGELPDHLKSHKDLLGLYLGKPQKYNTVGISDNSPSVSEDNSSQYYSINNPDFNNYVVDALNRRTEDHGFGNKNTAIIKDVIGTGLGNFKVSKGEDKKGKYVSYYDIWDVNPYKGDYSATGGGKKDDLSFGIGKPYELYDRIYYDENKNYEKDKNNLYNKIDSIENVINSNLYKDSKDSRDPFDHQSEIFKEIKSLKKYSPAKYANGGQLENNNNMYNPNLPQYGFGDWLKSNAGTIGSVAGGAIGGALGSVIPGAGTMAGASLGASLGGQVGGSIQENYEGDEAADAQGQQMMQMQQQQAYQNRLGQAQQSLGNSRNQFAGTQNFAFGGPLGNGIDSIRSGGQEPLINYNQLFPQKTPDGQDYYITNRSTKNQNDPNFFPFGDKHMVFLDSTQVFNQGNTRGISVGEDSRVNFNSDSTGDDKLFRQAAAGKLSYEDLGIKQPQLNQKALGGNLGNYSNGGGLMEDYAGNKHEDGGIQVDRMGNPSIISGEQAIAEVEAGETSHTFEDGSVYIFSDRLNYVK